MPDNAVTGVSLIQINVPGCRRDSLSIHDSHSGCGKLPEQRAMLRHLLRVLVFYLFVILVLAVAAFADDQPATNIQEEVWAIPVTLPTIAYVVRPVGKGPFPLVVMNHGVSLNPQERSFFPLVEFRDAAMWFARKGYMVVAPTGSGYGAAALDVAERGLYGAFYSKIGSCDNPNFRDAGLAVALLDKWIIDYMADQKVIVPDNVVVVGQSAGGWAAIALSSRNLPSVRAIITFAAGRGGRVGGKPNNNCAPDKLVEATGEFGRTARVPMLWIYTENDTFFGPALSRKMHEAYTGAGGSAEYHMLPPFGSDGHFLIDSADAIPLWAPLVSQFLDKRQ
jgi:dienelactone hydrolase